MSYSLSNKNYAKVYAVRLSNGTWGDKYDSNRFYVQKSAATRRANIINSYDSVYWKPDGVTAEVVEAELNWVPSNK
jgi:hypothetical protein